MKSLNITIRDFQDSTIHSQHGVTTYREWCDKEAARINKGVGRDVAFVKEVGNLCWVIRCDRAHVYAEGRE